MFILLNWSCIEDISVVFEEEGTGNAKAFNTENEAEKYAEDELNHYWTAVDLGNTI